MRKSLRSAFMALLLVVSAISGAGVAPAAAAHNCEELDFAIAFLAPGVNERCYNIHVSHTVEQMEAVDAKQTRLDAHQGMLDEKAKIGNMHTRLDNRLQDTKGAAWSEAEIAIAREWKNGSSKAAVRSAAKTAIRNYYSKIAVNYVSDANTTMAGIKKIENTTRMEDNVSDRFAKPAANRSGMDFRYARTNDWVTREYTLPNGSTIRVRAIRVNTRPYSDGVDAYGVVDPLGGANTIGDTSSTFWAEIHGYRVNAPDSDYDPVTVDFRESSKRWTKIDQQSSALTAEVGNFSDKVYDGLESGRLNATDVINRNTAMFKLASGELEGNNSLYRSTVALGMMGYEHPDLNRSGVMKVDYDSTTYEGLLLAEQAPGSSWSAGTTYNTSNVTGPVMLVTTGGEYFELQGEFTVRNITNKRGDEIQSVNHTQTTYKTSNVDELLKKMEQIQEARQEAEEREDRIIVRDGTSGSNLPLIGAVAVLALIVVAMVTKR